MVVLDDGVDRGGLVAGFFCPEEHPVFHAEFCGADGVFDEVIVNLQKPVFEVAFKAVPLAVGVLQGFAEEVAGPVAGHEDFEDGFEAFDDGTTLAGAGCLAKARSCSAFAELRFDAVKLAHEAEDFPAVLERYSFVRVFFEGCFCFLLVFVEATANVREAAHEDDLGMMSFVGEVGGPAIALECTGEVFADGFDQLRFTPTNPPMIVEASVGIVGEPEVAIF